MILLASAFTPRQLLFPCSNFIIRCRREEASVESRQLGVVFQDLTVQGLGAAASYQPTLGSALNPMRIWENIQRIRRPPVRNIITGFDGVVKPGEMLREFNYFVRTNTPSYPDVFHFHP